MRLTPQEIDSLIKAIKEFLGAETAELRLFGSRIDDQRKGGDIDLLLLVHHEPFKTQLLANKHLMLARIKELLGEQKIDLKIACFAELNTDPFLQLVYPNSLCLTRYSA